MSLRITIFQGLGVWRYQWRYVQDIPYLDLWTDLPYITQHCSNNYL